MKHYWGELVYVFSNTYSLALSMIASIVATAFIEPEDMGVIQATMLIQPYLGFLHFGVFNGLNRNLAFYKARNENDRVQDMVNTTYSVSYVVALLGLIISLGIIVYYIISSKSAVYFFAGILLLTHLAFNPLASAIETTYRSGQEFKRLGKIKNIESSMYAVLSALPIFLGYLGKIIADTFKNVVGYFLRAHRPPYRRTGTGSKDSLRLLVMTGFPMLISGYVWAVFVSCDQTFIATQMTTRDVGLYALSRYVITAVMVVPNAVNALLYPKAAANYGRTNDIHSLKQFWKKSIYIYILILVPVCLALYLLLPYMVTAFMPKYVDGIKAAQYSLLTCLTFISFGPSVLFGTLRRNTFYIIMLVCSIALFWGVSLAFKEVFSSIESLALLRFVISLIQMVLILIVTYRFVE